jgi:uncharacterized protein (DUF983 family)
MSDDFKATITESKALIVECSCGDTFKGRHNTVHKCDCGRIYHLVRVGENYRVNVVATVRCEACGNLFEAPIGSNPYCDECEETYWLGNYDADVLSSTVVDWLATEARRKSGR